MSVLGQVIHNEVVAVVQPSIRDWDCHHLARRITGRLIEEAVELCLASGQEPGEVMLHVVDALANEGRKIKRFPSELCPPLPDLRDAEVMVEVGDVSILLSYVAYLYGLERPVHDGGPTLREMQEVKKIGELKKRVENNEMVVMNGLLYKKLAKEDW